MKLTPGFLRTAEVSHERRRSHPVIGTHRNSVEYNYHPAPNQGLLFHHRSFRDAQQSRIHSARMVSAWPSCGDQAPMWSWKLRRMDDFARGTPANSERRAAAGTGTPTTTAPIVMCHSPKTIEMASCCASGNRCVYRFRISSVW